MTDVNYDLWLSKRLAEAASFNDMKIILERFHHGQCIYCGNNNMEVLPMKDLYCRICDNKKSQCEESVVMELFAIINNK